MQHMYLDIFYKKKQLPTVLFSPQLGQYFFSLIFLMTNILIGVRIYLTVILVCISMMITDVDQFVSARWPSVRFLWKKTSVWFFCQFLNGIEREPWCTVGRKVKWFNQSLWEILWRFYKKLKIDLPYDSAVLFLGI